MWKWSPRPRVQEKHFSLHYVFIIYWYIIHSLVYNFWIIFHFRKALLSELLRLNCMLWQLAKILTRTLAVLTDFSGFFHLFQTPSWIVPQYSNDHFLSNPSHFIIHQTSYYSALHTSHYWHHYIAHKKVGLYYCKITGMSLALLLILD
jgi:hypothetical protein